MKSIADSNTGRVSTGHGSLAQKAYMTMRQRIVRGEFALGQVISRRRIATELGISFMPASEALLRLECDGLLEKRPRSGTRVRIPTRHNVSGHFVLREALEVQSAMLFSERATAVQRAELTDLARALDLHALQPDGDPLVYTELHESLHLRLAECSGCKALFDNVQRASALASTWLGEVKTPVPNDPPGHHETLLSSLVSSGPAGAAGIMRSHIRLNAASVMRTLEPFFQLHKEYKATYSRTIGKASRPDAPIPSSAPDDDLRSDSPAPAIYSAVQ